MTEASPPLSLSSSLLPLSLHPSLISLSPPLSHMRYMPGARHNPSHVHVHVEIHDITLYMLLTLIL